MAPVDDTLRALADSEMLALARALAARLTNYSGHVRYNGTNR